MQSSAVEVREALALLGDSDEFRVRALTDAEPPAQPLGPFAVVDILEGTAPDLAARRQELGYYELARTLAEVRTQPAPQSLEDEGWPQDPTPSAEGTTARLSQLLGPGEAQRKERAKKEKETPKQTVAERIAPRKRGGTIPTNAASEVDLSRDEELPIPRGRFTRLEAPKEPLGQLYANEARENLEGLVEQHPNRVALLRAMSQRYSGRKGLLDMEDLKAVLSRHALDRAFVAKERDLVLGTLTDNRGALSRAAFSLDLTGPELRSLIDQSELATEVEELRERFRREALAPKNLKLRLDLLARSKYLDDLGIRRKFSERLEGELRELFRETLPDATSFDHLIELTSRRHAVDASSLRRAVERLGLLETLSRKVADSAARSN
ncbi:MAG: hypothetical protein M3Y59_21980 [Myxococcota bacterium]|nr:hypothetical protein [Myxococcota bacterium]